MEDLVKPGLGLVPSLLARIGEVDADRDRRHLAFRPIVPGLNQKFLVFGMTAAGAGGQMVAAPCGPGNALVPHRGHPDRRTWFLNRGCRHPHIGELVILALVTEFLSREAALDDPERFEGPSEPFAERDAESAEFLRGRADADREIAPPARDVVEDRDVLGD